MNLSNIAQAYNILLENFEIHKLGNGLIHKTFLLKNKTETENSFVLQNINTHVFKEPEIIAHNCHLASLYLKEKHPSYTFLNFLKTKNNQNFYTDINGALWRLMYFIENTISYDTLDNKELAYASAHEFAKLTNLLSHSNIKNYKEPIPNFHNLEKRFNDFKISVIEANSERLAMAKDLIDFSHQHQEIKEHYQTIKAKDLIPIRIIHADTKINNILFDKNTLKPLCVVDLDTLMPGYFFSDLGDMFRTMLCNCSEDEVDKEKIILRHNFFESIVSGYLKGMNNSLTKEEIKLLTYSGKFMLYMQGLRFLTDFLQNDIYYPISYNQHNLDRAACQFHILKIYLKEENSLKKIIEPYLSNC